MDNGTILMFENDGRLRKIGRGLLEREGYRVLAPATLAEGRALLETETPGLLLLDSEMPDGSGLDFCREIRAKSEVPIMIVTHNTAKEDIEAGYQAGCDDYLSKIHFYDVYKARVGYLLRRGAGRRGEAALPLREYVILLAEDDRRTLDYICNLFSLNGYRVLACQTLQEVRDAEKRERADLILLDAELPDGSALDFCRELSKQNSRAAPVLLHSLPVGKNSTWDCFCAGGRALPYSICDYEMLLYEVRNYLP